MPVTPSTERFTSESSRSNTYPNPFFDLANSYIPKNIKTLFKFCREYYYTSGWLKNVVSKMSTYPVTDILFDTTIDPEVKKAYSRVLNEKLKIKSFLIEIGLDYYTYGNTFISVFIIPKRFLKCTKCGQTHDFKAVKHKLKWQNLEFYGACPNCGTTHSKFLVEDSSIKSIENFRLLRISPENVDVEYNPITGTSTYYYTIPEKLKAQIIKGNLTVLETIPLEFITSLQKKRKIELDNSNLYHLKYPSLAEEDMGFGKPMILPALKEIYYLAILRKANEAIANEHIIPKKTISPANTVTIDPITGMNLLDWKTDIINTMRKWKSDPNYIAVMPIPMQYQELGGNAKMLMVTQEMKFLEESIINSLGVPLEFIKGGTSWSGSSISLRIVENGFLNYREFLEDFLNYFLIPKVSILLGYPTVSVKFKKFKMSDDTESKQLAIQLNQGGKISDSKLVEEFGYDYAEEREALRQSKLAMMEDAIVESEKQAEAQGRGMLINAQYQARAQKIQMDEQFKQKVEIMQNEIARETGGIPDDVFSLIDKWALEMAATPAPMQQQRYFEMARAMPVTASFIMERFNMYNMQNMQMQMQMQQMMPQLAPEGGQGQPKDGKAPNQQEPGSRKKDKVEIENQDKGKAPTKGEPK
jgi:hypothetical protein